MMPQCEAIACREVATFLGPSENPSYCDKHTEELVQRLSQSGKLDSLLQAQAQMLLDSIRAADATAPLSREDIIRTLEEIARGDYE